MALKRQISNYPQIAFLALNASAHAADCLISISLRREFCRASTSFFQTFFSS
jgi:hypothetical protein